MSSFNSSHAANAPASSQDKGSFKVYQRKDGKVLSAWALPMFLLFAGEHEIVCCWNIRAKSTPK